MVDRRRGYNYYAIGNGKTSTIWEGEPVTIRVANYTANSLNQYTQVAWPAPWRRSPSATTWTAT